MCKSSGRAGQDAPINREQEGTCPGGFSHHGGHKIDVVHPRQRRATTSRVVSASRAGWRGSRFAVAPRLAPTVLEIYSTRRIPLALTRPHAPHTRGPGLTNRDEMTPITTITMPTSRGRRGEGRRSAKAEKSRDTGLTAWRDRRPGAAAFYYGDDALRRRHGDVDVVVVVEMTRRRAPEPFLMRAYRVDFLHRDIERRERRVPRARKFRTDINRLYLQNILP